jgi:hypothetical protein
MRSTNFAWMAVAGGLAVGACSSSHSYTGFIGNGGRAASGGITGQTGQAGATTPSCDVTPTGGNRGQGGSAGSVGSAGSDGAVLGGSSGAFGGAGGAEVLASAGCGRASPSPMGLIGCGTPQYGKFTMTITAQSVLQFNVMPGANQAVTRQYYVRLPDGYDNSKPYRVIYQGTSCASMQDSIPMRAKAVPQFASDPNSSGALTGAILVQLEPGTYNPAAFNSQNCTVKDVTGCNAFSAYCFDDWTSTVGTPQVASIPDGPNGAVAMEKAYFDALHKTIEENYCVDKSRQFYAGWDSGGWLAQQLGCWFPDVLRAQANVAGGIPPVINANAMGANDYCVNHPIGYFSFHNSPDASDQFQGSVDGARRVFALNGCTGTFPVPPLPSDTAIPDGLEVYQIRNSAGTLLVPNDANSRCYHYTTCPEATPMYFCVSTNEGHDAQSARAAPAFWEFFSRF